jgi:hypothetical protein
MVVEVPTPEPPLAELLLLLLVVCEEVEEGDGVSARMSGACLSDPQYRLGDTAPD